MIRLLQIFHLLLQPGIVIVTSKLIVSPLFNSTELPVKLDSTVTTNGLSAFASFSEIC